MFFKKVGQSSEFFYKFLVQQATVKNLLSRKS